MRRRSTARRLGAVALALVLLAVGFLPADRSTLTGGSLHFSKVGPPTSTPSLPPPPPPPVPVAVTVPGTPIDGRFFQTNSTLPLGTSNSVTGLDVDSATGTVFAANEFGGTVTAFNESTGTVDRVALVASFSGGSFPASLLLDASHARLFVSISTRFASATAAGWLLVLNESTFAVEVNVSFPRAPGAPFEPSYLAYDAPSGQLFVENASMGEIAVVNVTSWAVTSYVICPVPMCVEHGYGLLDVPQFHTLVVPTCTPELWLVNTTNDSTRAVIAGSASTVMAWATYDTVDHILWVENYTYSGPRGSFLKVNLTTLSIVANVPGALPRGTAIAYDARDNEFLATNLNGSEEINAYNAANAALVANYSASSGVHPFVTLAFDRATGTAIAAGPGNGTTIAFSVPGLTLRKTYSSFAFQQTASAVDSATGDYLVAGINPTTLRASSESTSSTVWESPLPSSASPSAIVVDPTSGVAIVSDSAGGQLLYFNAANGAPTGALSVGATSGPCALALDSMRQLLYVAESSPPAVAVVNLTRNAVVGSISLSGELPCGLALDPVTGDLLVLSTSSGHLIDVRAPSLTLNTTWSVTAPAVALAVNSTGAAFVLDNSGAHLTVLNGSTGALLSSVSFGGIGGLGTTIGTALAVDSIENFLFVAMSGRPWIAVFGWGPASPTSYASALPTPAVAAAPSFDAASGVLVAPTAATGQLFVAALVPVPSAPTNLRTAPGNNSVSLTWAPPAVSGPYPVDGYDVREHPVGVASGGLGTSAIVPSATFGNLTNGQSYRMTVAAHSAAGLGTARAVALVTPVGVPYPPTNATATALSSTSIMVRWSPPASVDGAPVREYDIVYWPAGSPGSPSVQVVGLPLSWILAGLASSTNYTILVVAANLAGASHPSAALHVATPAAPPSAAILTFVAVGTLVVALVVGLAAVLRRRARPPPPPEPTVPPPLAGTAGDLPLPSTPPE